MGPYRSYRAPADDGAALVDPSFDDLRNRLRQRNPLADSPITFGGQPLEAIAAEARANLVEDARRYTKADSGVADAATRGPLVVSGHQPELFHPGVWFKNFALDALARSVGGVGVHLLIDSDLCRVDGVRAPACSVDRPRVEAIAFDTPAAATPYEERRIVDSSVFDAFDERLAETVKPFVAAPLVERLWRHAREACGRTDRLGEATSAARRSVEAAAGLATLELPFSRVCDTRPFRRFAWELIQRADDFRSAYNAALGDYRAAHKLRSAAQPLPDLRSDGGAVETAFWCWTEADPIRRPLLARPSGGGVELGDGARELATLSPDVDDAVEQLAELRSQGVKVRSRALATTLYCRWVLADLFLHGIGGAKYDQVTDRLSERFFGAPPPPHATLSATLRLPIAGRGGDADSPEDLRRELRELRFHPERHAAAIPAATRWIEQKRAAVAREKTPTNAGERHRAIVEANAAMFVLLAERRVAAERRLRSALDRRRADAILDSREYAFCLFPETVVARLKRLAGGGDSHHA